MSRKSSAATGERGEERAASYLISQGCTILARNWQAHPGEIDIVAQCPSSKTTQTLAFVEVRTRHGRTGLAEESISSRKASSMTTAAYAYMQANNIDPEHTDWRIDLISIAVQDTRTTLNWIKGAIPRDILIITMTIETPTIEIVDATHPDAQDLIRQLSKELGTIYGHDGAGAFTPADVAVPRAAFIIAYTGGQPVACGAIRPFSDDHTSVEVKRMFVIPEARGKGISRLILRKLESLASSFDYTTLKLETGIHQHAAIALYQNEGYVRIPCYGKYVNDPDSLCYGKPVAARIDHFGG